MSSAVILEQNWKSEQVRPGHSPGWLYGAGLVTRREAETGAGAVQTVSENGEGLLEVDRAFGVLGERGLGSIAL